jgi:phosphoglycolate phosphatase-like HAD superfamily hydrolase
MHRYLVLFDIDGTLLWPDGLGRTAMEAALIRIYGTAGPVGGYYFGGRTDREVVRDLMLAAGLSPQTIWACFADLEQALEEEMRSRIAQGLHRIRPCPGAPELVAALATREDVLLGLLTGNIQPTAILKLQAAGYTPTVFKVGGYGNISTVRSELLSAAVQQAGMLTGEHFRGEQVVVIGDTPADVLCGQAFGARGVAVLTGHHDVAELQAADPSAILPDLSDLARALPVILAPLPDQPG